MFHATSPAAQYAAAQGDPVRVLVVGAGLAGTTVAQLLRTNGRHPVVIERAPDPQRLTSDERAGYMLALMPMVDPVFTELDAWDAYRSRSVTIDRFGLHGRTGKFARVDSLSTMLEQFGEYRGIARGDLLSVLSSGGANVTFTATVAEITDTTDHATITIRHQDEFDELEFDLVIVSDGLHSHTRDNVLEFKTGTFDTGWVGWVVWAAADDRPDFGEEMWGAGFFLGVYPVRERLGVFLGGPAVDLSAGPGPFADRVRSLLKVCNVRIDRALAAVAEEHDPYFWPMTDVRAQEWVNGRTVLLGDAAAGFLPTAGIGAGMAMESAWVLAGMLDGVSAASAPELVRRFESAQRPRVETAQDNSRSLAKLMFRDSRALAAMRDLAIRAVSIRTALKPIRKLLRTRPNPAELAQSGSVSNP